MEQIAVFIDNATHARRIIEPMLTRSDDQWRWVVVACPPRLSRHVGRWVSHVGRQQWQRRWLQDLRRAIDPMFARQSTDGVQWLLADGALEPLGRRLRSQYGAGLHLLDARVPKLGRPGEPLSAGQPATTAEEWRAPVAVSSSLAVMLALAD